MAVRVVMFDVGGVFEVIPEGGDPSTRYPAFLAEWDRRLGFPDGRCDACLSAVDEDGAFGRCTYPQWCERLQASTGMSDAELQEFTAGFWDIYMGNANEELLAYARSLRPRYRTAILTNSYVGAREAEEARFGLTSLVDLAIYSHEEGMRKPDPHFFALACERVGARPDEIVFLDDSPGHVAAAIDYSLHAIRFENTAQAIADIEACLAAHPA